MRTKVVFPMALLGLMTVQAWAQQSITLTVPSEGEYVAFTGSNALSAAPADPLRIEKGAGSLLPHTGDTTAYVWDKKSGNLASKPVAEALKGWTLQKKDFNQIAQVHIRVDHEGKAVAAAGVELNDGKRTMSQLIDPSAKGEVEFFAVNPGSLKVTVKVRSGGATNPVTQLFDVKIDHADVVPTFKVSIADVVETVATTQAGSQKSDQPVTKLNAAPEPTKTTEKPEQAPGGFGKVIVFLFAIAFAVGIGFLAMHFMKQNPKVVQDNLEKLGVQIPKPGDAPVTDPGPIPIPAKPEPQQKIVLDNAAPDPIVPLTPSIPVVSAPSSTGPTLVSESGVGLPLQDAEVIVGREVGLGVSLASESTVSRRHAKLERQGNDVILTDLGSTNGTYVNGAKVETPVVLRAGDAVQFGSVRFRYEA